MHYEEYCKPQSKQWGTALGADDFYDGLNQIAQSRSTVLADIEQMSIRKLSRKTVANTIQH